MNQRIQQRRNKKAEGGKWLLICLCLFLFIYPTKAITRTSVSSGNYNSSSTWLPNGIPTTPEHIVIASGNTVTISSNQTIHNLTVNSGGLVNWSGGFKLSISGSLTVNGKVDMNGGN